MHITHTVFHENQKLILSHDQTQILRKKIFKDSEQQFCSVLRWNCAEKGTKSDHSSRKKIRFKFPKSKMCPHVCRASVYSLFFLPFILMSDNSQLGRIRRGTQVDPNSEVQQIQALSISITLWKVLQRFSFSLF